jgi:hypothetical protein
VKVGWVKQASPPWIASGSSAEVTLPPTFLTLTPPSLFCLFLCTCPAFQDTADPFTYPPRPKPLAALGAAISTQGASIASVTAKRSDAPALLIKGDGVLGAAPEAAKPGTLLPGGPAPVAVHVLPYEQAVLPEAEELAPHMGHPRGHSKPYPLSPAPLARIVQPPVYPAALKQPGNMAFIAPHPKPYVNWDTRMVDNAYTPGRHALGPQATASGYTGGPEEEASQAQGFAGYRGDPSQQPAHWGSLEWGPAPFLASVGPGGTWAGDTAVQGGEGGSGAAGAAAAAAVMREGSPWSTGDVGSSARSTPSITRATSGGRAAALAARASRQQQQDAGEGEMTVQGTGVTGKGPDEGSASARKPPQRPSSAAATAAGWGAGATGQQMQPSRTLSGRSSSLAWSTAPTTPLIGSSAAAGTAGGIHGDGIGVGGSTAGPSHQQPSAASGLLPPLPPLYPSLMGAGLAGTPGSALHQAAELFSRTPPSQRMAEERAMVMASDQAAAAAAAGGGGVSGGGKT